MSRANGFDSDLYSSLFEHNPDAIFLTVPGVGIKCANAAACKMFGMSEEELCSGEYQKLVDASDQDLHSLFESRAQTREIQGELKLVRKNGTKFTADVSAVTLDGGTCAFFIVKDVTERIHFEENRDRLKEELSKELSLRKAVLSTIPAYVYLKDKNSVYKIANKAFAEFAGVPEEMIPGKTDFDLFPKADAKRYRKKDAKVLLSGMPELNYQEQGTDSKGNVVWFSTSKCPFYDSSGDLAGIVGICFNITNLKNVEGELRSLNEQLERRVKERTSDLEAKKLSLEELNTALRVLLDKREGDRKELEDSIAGNLKKLVLPFVEKLQRTSLSDEQSKYLSIIQSHLSKIESGFVRKLTLHDVGFTPTEIRIAVLIREGKASKEISEILHTSHKAIAFHRDNIRRKLNLKNKKENLRSHLIAFQ